MLRRLSPGCQQLYNPSRAAIINKKWSLNVKISKVAMPQYECIILERVSSQQNDLWKVSVWYKLSSHKIITKTSGLCPSVSISKSNIHEKNTTNHTSSDQNEHLLIKAIVVMWREYLTSPKEKSMSQCEQPPMKGLCPSIGQTLKWLNSAACSHKCPCPDPIISKICQQWWEGCAPIITSRKSPNHISYSNMKGI